MDQTLRKLAVNSRPYLLLLPALSVIGILFGGGLVLAFIQSVGLLTFTGTPEFSLQAYRTVLQDPDLLRSLWTSLWVAVSATGTGILLSIGLALVLRRVGRWASFACQITLPIPHLVGVVGLIMLLSPSGLISRILLALGWIQSDQEFPLLINDPHYVGVLIHFLWKEIPFATLIFLSVLRGIPLEFDIQARALGASPWLSFWSVTLPLMKPGILSASVIVFGFIFGSFEVPFLLGPTYPKLLPIQIYHSFTNVDLNQRGEAIALGILLAMISTLIVSMMLWIGQWGSKSNVSQPIMDGGIQ